MTNEQLHRHPARPRGEWLPVGCVGGLGGGWIGASAYARVSGWIMVTVFLVVALVALVALLVPQESRDKVELWNLVLNHLAGTRSHPRPPGRAPGRRRPTR